MWRDLIREPVWKYQEFPPICCLKKPNSICSKQVIRNSHGRFAQIPTQTLREELGTIGRWAEHSMLQCTGQVSTHRGAVWVFGLLVAAVAMGAASVEAIAETARQLACLPNRNASEKEIQGLQAT
jgi:hypothetical protein